MNGKLIKYGRINPTGIIEEKLLEVTNQLNLILKEYKPTFCAIEDVNCFANPKVAKLLAEFVGCIRLTCFMYNNNEMRFYPSTSQGIQALVTKPSGSPSPQNWASGGYLKKLPVDPWGNAYHYAHPGSHGSVDIWSDGPPDGSGKNKKIGNWDANQ